MSPVIYSDGSCFPNPGPGAWAFVVFQGRAEIHSAAAAVGATTNNKMELQAVLEALWWLDGRPARILSDSQYVINGITQWSAKWKRNGWKRKERGGTLVEVKNGDLWRAIDAARGAGQTFAWVRGHNGDPGNERADELAEMARAAFDPGIPRLQPWGGCQMARVFLNCETCTSPSSASE